MLGGILEQQSLLFSIPALLGTAVFVLRLGLMALGGFGVDVDSHGGLDGHGADLSGHGHADSTHAFNLLSVQSIAAFLMCFGWGALAAQRGLDWSMQSSVMSGLGFGAAMVWVFALVMKGVYNLQGSGNIRIDAAHGAQGVVYARVPAPGQGRGQVRVVINDRARIYNAVSEDGPIDTSTRVRVLRVNEDHTLTVAPV
jgi:membrane protein implicated in regulation of membrane protease activity